MEQSKLIRAAAGLLALSGVLHLLVPVLAGFSSATVIMFAIGIAYLAGARGLIGGSRLLAYLVFVVMLIGALTAYIGTGPDSLMPDWLAFAIVVANVGCAVCLFGHLWRPRAETAG